jgi:small subunit ribosomal protein S17
VKAKDNEMAGKNENAQAQTAAKPRASKVGVVVGAKMQKTVVVAVERLVRHDVYRKRIKRTSTFMAHDETGARRGDRVRIEETRPLSKNKRWRVVQVVEKAPLTHEDTAEAGS